MKKILFIYILTIFSCSNTPEKNIFVWNYYTNYDEIDEETTFKSRVYSTTQTNFDFPYSDARYFIEIKTIIPDHIRTFRDFLDYSKNKYNGINLINIKCNDCPTYDPYLKELKYKIDDNTPNYYAGQSILVKDDDGLEKYAFQPENGADWFIKNDLYNQNNSKLLIEFSTSERGQKQITFDISKFNLYDVIKRNHFKEVENKSEKISSVNAKKEADTAIITYPNGTTNVRSGKGTNYPVIYELKTNETFDVYPTNDKWWLVEINNNQKGYIFYDRVSLIRNNLDGKYTYASNYFLDEDDLYNFPENGLKIMRNEIFARYGYIFKEGGEMKDYFKDQRWYTPKYKNVDSKITKLEKFNIKIIKSYEDGSAYDRLVPDPENISKSKTNNSTSKSKPNSINGKYSYSEPGGVELIVNVYGGSWSGQTKICQYCDVEYDRGVLKGNALYDSSGYIEIGYISGNSLHIQVHSGSAVLNKN